MDRGRTVFMEKVKKMTDEKLLKCPFCGTDATYTDGEAPNGDTIFFIGCKQRGCVAYFLDNNNYFYSLENAIEMWNRRFDDEHE